MNNSVLSTFGVRPLLLHSFEPRQMPDKVVEIKCDIPSFNQKLKILESKRKMAEVKLYYKFDLDRKLLYVQEKC